MLTRRLIVCLDVAAGRVVKGTHFERLRDAGDPVALAEQYERDGADEIVFLDVSASAEERATRLEVARRMAERLFIPLTIGGGVRGVDDVSRALRAGADKVSLNSAAVEHPEVLAASAERFGAQCVVASIDVKREEGSTPSWRVYTHGGRRRTDRDAVAWAQECVQHGAGEILLTSIDRDGTRSGYDLELTRAVSRAVHVPVIASGGAGCPDDVRNVLCQGEADAALVAGILHDGESTVRSIKRLLRTTGLPIREVV